MFFLVKGEALPYWGTGRSPAPADKKLATLTAFESGMEHYFRKEFYLASQAFQSVLMAYPDDHISKLMLSRSATLTLSGLPGNWDGTEQVG